MTNYEFDYSVDGKVFSYVGKQGSFDQHIYGLMTRGYFVKVLYRKRLTNVRSYGNV